LATYAYFPFGLTAIGSGFGRVATVAGDFGVRFPVVASVLYWEMLFPTT
jgi:hypothetical protein